MKYFYQLNKILTPAQKKSFIFLTALMFVSMIFEILTLNSLLILLRGFSDPANIVDSKAIMYLEKLDLNFDLYLQILFIFLIIFLVKTLVNISISWKENKYIFFTSAELSHDFFKGYLYLPKIFHLRTNISETIKNITSEIDHLISTLHAIAIIIMETIVLLGLVTFLMFVNFKIALLSFISLIIFSIVISFFNTQKVLMMGKNRVKFFQLRLQYIIEGLMGSKVFALTGSQKKIISDFNEYNYKIASLSHSVGFRQNLSRPLFELFILLIAVLFFFYTFRDHSQMKSIIPTLGVFLSAAYRLAPSFAKIMSNLQRFQFSVQTVGKLSRDKEKFSKKDEMIESHIKIDFKKGITLKNVGYSYSKNTKLDKNFVLKNINIEIPKGSKIGIMGNSGSGKSTFLDIIMALVYPQEGEILIDGKNISEIKNSWQKIIGCVPQDVFIIDASLKKNIAFGLSDDQIDVDKVNQAIESANLTDLRNGLKYGIETLVGEKGSRLSGGQRQRIGTARALYNNPEVLLFDEATNALDIQTEKNVIKEIFLSGEDKTIIFVSHNPENLKYCNSIFEMKNRNLTKLN